MTIAMFLAVLTCTLFAGAAMYITLVEHPARMGLETKTAAGVWAPSYGRAVPMMASLALLGSISALVAFALGGGVLWLIGALLLGAVIPFTFIVIMPVNKRLLAYVEAGEGTDARSLLEKWGRLHTVRTVLSSVACLVLLYAFTQVKI